MLPGHLVISLFDFMSLWEYLVEPGCALVDMSTHSQYPKYVFSSWVIRPLSQQGKNPNNLLLEIYFFVLGEKIIPPEDGFVNMYTDKGRRLYCIKERKIIRSDPFGTEILWVAKHNWGVDMYKGNVGSNTLEKSVEDVAQFASQCFTRSTMNEGGI